MIDKPVASEEVQVVTGDLIAGHVVKPEQIDMLVWRKALGVDLHQAVEHSGLMYLQCAAGSDLHSLVRSNRGHEGDGRTGRDSELPRTKHSDWHGLHS